MPARLGCDPQTGSTTPVALTVLSMSSVQLGDAWSVALISGIGAPGTAWLRSGFGALILLVLVRPRVRSVTVAQWRVVVLLGVSCAVLSMSFLASLQWLPLGTAVAIEFLGPLGVAVVHAGRRGACWPLLALVGVMTLTRPWHGGVPLTGVLLASTSAAAWAGSIVLTARVGHRVSGLTGVALALPVAAVCLTPWGCVTAMGVLGPADAVRGLGLAVLMPVAPYVLELVALRRLPRAAFATLMSLEPALAAVAGVVVLHQELDLLGALGVMLVVAAGVGVTHRPGRGRRSAVEPSRWRRRPGRPPDHDRDHTAA